MTNSRTILVVDDEPAIGECLTVFLTGQGYRVLCFTNGKDALDYLKNNFVLPRRHQDTKNSSCLSVLVANNFLPNPGLLLTDMQMPEMTGLELARQVKTLYPALPIIVMSGTADGRDREEIFSLGADFIPKPFDLANLLERIERVVPVGDPVIRRDKTQ